MTNQNNRDHELLETLIFALEYNATRVVTGQAKYPRIPKSAHMADLWPRLYGACIAHGESDDTRRIMAAIERVLPTLKQDRDQGDRA